VGVPSSQALPGYLITAPTSVCVSDVIGALAVWIQKQKQKTSLPITGGGKKNKRQSMIFWFLFPQTNKQT